MTVPFGDRLTQLNLAASLMGDTQWKNTVAPPHDHMIGGERAIVVTREGREVKARLHNCPRCGDAAADRIWPLALEEALRRMQGGELGPGDLLHTMHPDEAAS